MISLYIMWYERKPNYEPDYNRPHHAIVSGETPKECMEKYDSLRENHDLCKNTRMEIEFIF